MGFHELVPIGLGASADGVVLEEALLLQRKLEAGEPVEKIESQIPHLLVDISTAHCGSNDWSGQTLCRDRQKDVRGEVRSGDAHFM